MATLQTKSKGHYSKQGSKYTTNAKETCTTLNYRHDRNILYKDEFEEPHKSGKTIQGTERFASNSNIISTALSSSIPRTKKNTIKVK